MLQLMLETGKTVSELAKEIPTYHMAKKKLECSKGKAIPLLDALSEFGADAAAIDRQDGIKFDYPEGWVHVRSSNTEPIVRVYSEARTQEMADGLAKRFLDAGEKFLAKA
jgi:phosphomannomutase